MWPAVPENAILIIWETKALRAVNTLSIKILPFLCLKFVREGSLDESKVPPDSIPVRWKWKLDPIFMCFPLKPIKKGKTNTCNKLLKNENKIKCFSWICSLKQVGAEMSL